ncbi:DUF4132 domain-containing protein [Streptomyces sp. WMMC500]|uniref:DUF4132 domain-containing protein n=1 Tax=Streptomyces sp. WMMC500 TaxID=3015154 RepID=UPI00248C767F|nr:DUF4132 domain-containing protein [Streptomyces sp. WMMC500]WBB61764.1 DUF4132 domain-containing protein [Streptomyces sp. WMMC500]
MSTPLVWVPATHGHELALDGTTLRCRKSDGRVLQSVPGAVRSSSTGEKFTALAERLVRHEEECRSTVESWLLAGVPVPAALLGRVWPDPGWRSALEHLVVVVDGRTGLLTEVTDEGRTALVGEDGTAYAPPVAPVSLPHPVLLPDVDTWRELLDDRGAAQGVPQLAREVHHRPDAADPAATGLDDYAGGEFEELRYATGRAARYGFVMRGGFAMVRIADGGVGLQARYWLGADDPGLSTETGRLLWVDASERPVALGKIGPVAWSEGVRMAELIYAGRTIHDR